MSKLNTPALLAHTQRELEATKLELAELARQNLELQQPTNWQERAEQAEMERDLLIEAMRALIEKNPQFQKILDRWEADLENPA